MKFWKRYQNKGKKRSKTSFNLFRFYLLYFYLLFSKYEYTQFQGCSNSSSISLRLVKQHCCDLSFRLRCIHFFVASCAYI